MKTSITLRPQGVIPRDPKLVLRMQRSPKPATVAVAAATSAPDDSSPPPDDSSPPSGVTIGAGADNFADATLIPYEIFRDVVAEYTYNKTLTVESGEPDPDFSISPVKTAWWKFYVPPGAKIYAQIDLMLSFMAGVEADPDTVLAVHALVGDALNPADQVFANLTRIRRNNSPPGSMLTLTGNAMLLDVEMDDATYGTGGNGTMYYVQVGAGFSSPSICYVLRMSATTLRPGEMPPDGHDPDA